jgi:DME family drug/metabolite transporter
VTFTPPALAGRGAPRLATLAVLIAALSFGTTGTVLVNAPEAADAWSVGAVRLLVGAATLLAVAARGGHRWIRPWRMRSTLLGALGVAGFQAGYFLAVERTGVAVGTVVTIGSGPMVAGVIAAVRDRRPPAGPWLGGTAVSVVGVALLGLSGRSSAADAVGVLLAFGAGCGWALFATVGKTQIEQGSDSTATMAAMFGGGALLLSPVLLAHDPGWMEQGNGWWIGLYLGVVTVGAAYTLYGFALRHLPTHTVVTLTLLEPITAAVLGAVLVHEGIHAAGWVGVALVVVGLWATARDVTVEEATGRTVA